jgi:hypothetical protein
MRKSLKKQLKGGMIWLTVSVLGSVASDPVARLSIMAGSMWWTAAAHGQTESLPSQTYLY